MPFGMAVTVEFSEFGLPIVLDLPPAADVMSPEEFMQQLMAYEQAHPSQGCGSDGTPTVTETTTDQRDGGRVGVLCLSSGSQEGGK
jgi:hypothetical protein